MKLAATGRVLRPILITYLGDRLLILDVSDRGPFVVWNPKNDILVTIYINKNK